MFAAKSYYTAGYAEIYAQGGGVKPQTEAVLKELRTHQVATRYEITNSSNKRLPTSRNGGLRFLSKSIASCEIDEMYDTVMRNGPGGGGFMLFFTEPKGQASIQKALLDMEKAEFDFLSSRVICIGE